MSNLLLRSLLLGLCSWEARDKGGRMHCKNTLAIRVSTDWCARHQTFCSEDCMAMIFAELLSVHYTRGEETESKVLVLHQLRERRVANKGQVHAAGWECSGQNENDVDRSSETRFKKLKARETGRSSFWDPVSQSLYKISFSNNLVNRLDSLRWFDLITEKENLDKFRIAWKGKFKKTPLGQTTVE